MPTVDELIRDSSVDLTRIPEHIAIIMDGNGRWAKQRLMPRQFGHRQGQKQLKKTVINCKKLGVKVLSVYVFSTENWRRPKDEVSFLMAFIKSSIQDEIDEMIAEGVQLRFLGALDAFDDSIKTIITDAEDRTKHGAVIQLNIMLNYGAQQELVDAMKSFVAGGGDVQQLTVADVTDHLYTAGIPDPDMVIRTGGDVRLSNFMLWQAAYSELFFLDVCWPAFDMPDLLTAIETFQARDRRYGGLSE